MDLKNIPDDHPDAEQLALGLAGTTIPIKIYTLGTISMCGKKGCGCTEFVILPAERPIDGPLVIHCADCKQIHYRSQSFVRLAYRLEMWARVDGRAEARGISPKDIY